MTTTQDTQATPEKLELCRPAADLFADDAKFVWLVDLPGIGSDEVELEIVDGKLALEATSPEFGLKYERRLLLPEEADPAQVDGMIAAAGKHGGVDVIVNSAAIARVQKFLEITIENWNELLAINLTGVFLCAQAAARTMRSRAIAPAWRYCS